jgi:hypothetical protein
LLIRNHLLCPYADCDANKRSGDLRIQVLVNQDNGEREVRLKPTIRGQRGRTKLPYKYTKEVYSDLFCPYCNRPVEVVIDETHVTRYVHLRQSR